MAAQLLTIGTTGVELDPETSIDGAIVRAVKCLVRVDYDEALAAGTHTIWFKRAGGTVAQPAPVWLPDTEANSTTSVAVRSVLYGPFLKGDTFGISSTGDQTGKAVYYEIIPL